MVAIFSGNGLGYQRGSSSVLGGSGTLGSAAFGRGGDNVYVNAATGNLVVDRKDEFLVGRGPDTLYAQTYNSMAAPAYSWAQSINRVLADFTGATNAAGSTVTRGDGDGHGTVYTYDAARGAYLSNEGGGSYDEIRFSGGVWTWTDGNSRTVETYTALAGAPGYQFLATLADADGNLQSYTWNANGTLQRITSANGDYSEFTLANGLPTQITTYYSTGAGTAALTRTRYVWDSLRRLTSVTVDLSPNDNSVADGKSYTNSYTYQGTTTRIASITQTDGSSLTITYDSLGRVATLTELASAGVSRTTTLGYGANYTNVTDANGQVTRLDYAAAANFATPVDAWASSNVTKETATIGGSAATNFTVQSTAWSAISQGVAVAAGDTVTFGVTMQAVGTVTSQSLGLYSDIDGWGAAGISSARIVSGPGQLVEAVGGLWTVTGLSTTQGTRIEVTRTYTTAQNAGAYLYFDHPGGYRAGTSLTLADISLMKSATAAPVSLLDLNNWYSAGVTRTAAGTIDGAAAYKYAVQAAGGWSAVYAGMAAKKGDSYSLSLSLQASDGYTSQSFGLYGDGDGWGSASGSTARIVSGPGTLSQAAGGLWTISGLSATQVTRVEIIRNYEQDESGGAYIYADLPGNFRAGASMTIAAAYLTKRMVEPAAARQLVKITAPPAYAGAPAQTVQFGYNDKGDLISVTDGAGSAATYAYDSSGNLISETDRLGNVITRTYGSKNELLTETRYGSNAGSADAALTTRYAYDAENHLRFIIGAEGNGTEYRYTASGEIEYQIEYPEHFYDVSAMAPTAPLSEATLNAALAGIADKSSIKITY
ncbi:MAG: hypothetical protein QOJ27_170, partial [Sphingomonadales bacterium]|nr:hypothetical protein [Sphingomonadales bacterium]